MGLKATAMSSVRIEIDEALAAVLHQTNQPVQAAAREMIVLELYRRGAISSGKAADLLGVSRLAFIQQASKLGIPYLEMTEDEWAAEKAASESL
jgi:predicted HTH domain antitoxin